jgi:hypothetical protein
MGVQLNGSGILLRAQGVKIDGDAMLMSSMYFEGSIELISASIVPNKVSSQLLLITAYEMLMDF